MGTDSKGQFSKVSVRAITSGKMLPRIQKKHKSSILTQTLLQEKANSGGEGEMGGDERHTSLINMRLAMERRVLGGKWLVIMIRSPASENESWCG